MPLDDREAKPHAVIAAQSDGVWVSLWGSDQIAHISDDGELAELPLPPASEPHGLVIGPDDALWVALGIRFCVALQRLRGPATSSGARAARTCR